MGMQYGNHCCWCGSFRKYTRSLLLKINGSSARGLPALGPNNQSKVCVKSVTTPGIALCMWVIGGAGTREAKDRIQQRIGWGK
ncbi:hypothetical protein G9A89_000200 [Geosiphon pyriformis]|nr:hypothetical protein G9A89_000200 [Geosiphon pyriformis]